MGKSSPCDRPRGSAALAGLALAALAGCGGVSESGPPRDGSPGTDARPGQETDGSTRPPVDAQPPGQCEEGVTQLLANPGFDEANPEENAVAWDEVGGFITYPESQLGGFEVHSPTRAAWIGKVGEPDQKLSQTVTVPPMTTSLALSFYFCFATDRSDEMMFDKVTISLLDAGGAPIEVLDTYTNQEAGSSCSWAPRTRTVDDPHAGEELTLEFHGQSDESTLTSFFFDTLSLDATGPCPE